jgi:hypothetical protein
VQATPEAAAVVLDEVVVVTRRPRRSRHPHHRLVLRHQVVEPPRPVAALPQVAVPQLLDLLRPWSWALRLPRELELPDPKRVPH